MAQPSDPQDLQTIEFHDETAVLFETLWGSDVAAFMGDFERHVLRNRFAADAVLIGTHRPLDQGSGAHVVVDHVPPHVGHLVRQILGNENPAAQQRFYTNAVHFLGDLLTWDGYQARPPAPEPVPAADPEPTGWSRVWDAARDTSLVL